MNRCGCRLVAGGVLAVCCAGCADPMGVFQERPGDLAPRLGAERVGAVQGLNVERFRREPEPAADLSSEALVGRALGAGAGQGAGAATLEWSLEQVRAGALAANLDVRASLIDPAVAGQAESAERAKFDAVFRPSVRAGKTDRASNNSTSVSQVRSGGVGLDVDIPLRTGGVLTLGGTGDYAEIDNPFVTFGDSYSLRLAPSLSLPLMRGSGRAVNSASIKVAGYRADIASAGTRLQVTGVLAEAERAYWRLAGFRQELEVRKKQFELARAQLERAERRARAGDAPEIEVTRAQSGVASRVEDVIRAETSVLIGQRALKRLVNAPGAPVEESAVVVTTTPPELARYGLEAGPLVALAEQNRMELLQSELQLLVDALEIDLAADATRPLVNVLAQYDISSSREKLDDSLQQLVRRRFQSYSVGVSGEVPLSNARAEAELRRAVLARMGTLATLEARRQAVKAEVLDAMDRVESAWQRIVAAQQAAVLAARTLEAESRQFDRGARTSTDVLDAAASLADAQSAEVRAVADYRIALVDLAVATGTVLGGAGVSWEEVPTPALSGDRWNGLRPAGEGEPSKDVPDAATPK